MKYNNMNRNQIIDRCLEIQKEYKDIENIHLSHTDIEDVSDLYQAKLEQQWYKQELEDEYKELNTQLEINKPTLREQYGK